MSVWFAFGVSTYKINVVCVCMMIVLYLVGCGTTCCPLLYSGVHSTYHVSGALLIMRVSYRGRGGVPLI